MSDTHSALPLPDTSAATTPKTALHAGKNPKLRARELWQIVKPYWTSGERWLALGLLALVLMLVGGDTAFNTWLSNFTKDSFDALQKNDAAEFNRVMLLSLAVVAVAALISALDKYVRQWLEFRWRRGLTEHFVGRWLSGNMFYRMERRQTTDNPDQRIAEDIRLFTEMSVNLSISFVRNLAQLVVFGSMLWASSGPATFGGITIPGYMFFVAVGFGLINTGITHWAGHRLAGLTIEQQRVEADFRYALAQQRESAEQIAMYRGAAVERGRLRGLFGAIGANWGQVTLQSMRINYVSYLFMFLGNFAPSIAMAPKLFSGESTLGDMMQSQMAFGFVAMCVGWFAMVYSQLYQWSAVTRRLIGLNQNLALPEDRGVDVAKRDDVAVSAQGLKLALPTGSTLTDVGDLRFKPGERWLVRGASGVGKSTLMRALAGLWPHGQGRVELPDDAKLMFLPQKSYIPPGSLKDALTYPSASDTYSDAVCGQMLADCRLPQLATRLHEQAKWGHILSGGEQQRLALARALLAKPDYLFLDEATSALDTDTEAVLYRLLHDRLPKTALVSVAHRASLDAFHENELVLAADTPAITRRTPHAA
jgi:vitamin B12/bleomycin/antimicrobial peptide transport system ATP-binding/permease protein